jgi:hypothetical protein
MHLKKWSAKRSGAGIRVTGFDTMSQKDAKVQVVDISPRLGGRIVATDKDGNEHELAHA